MSSTEPDPNLYAELCGHQFATAEEGDKALREFWDAVYELRIKHKLRDVTIIAAGNVKDSGPFIWSAHAGSSSESETMAAWHFGMAQSRRQESIREAMEEATRNSIHVGKRNRR